MSRSTGYKDIDGKDILVGMKVEDTNNKDVKDIIIIEREGKFYADPTGLDAEPLEKVVSGLKIK